MKKRMDLVKKGHYLSSALAKAYERYDEHKDQMERHTKKLFIEHHELSMKCEEYRIDNFVKRIEANEGITR